MSNYIDKAVDKNGIETDIHDARFPDGAVPGMVKAQDGKLKVDEVIMPVGPVPVATIDGVDYYHKQEFDLSEIEQTANGHAFDILTGEDLGSVYGPYPKYPCLHYANYTGGGKIVLGAGRYKAFSDGYTSQAFTVVQTQEEVTDNNKICLPGCTAYYGYLSEDGNTFISYWTESTDIATATPVTKIKDANNNEVEINDARIVAPAEATGKVLKDDFTWGEAGGSNLPYIELEFSNTPTLQDILDALEYTPQPYTSKTFLVHFKSPEISYQGNVIDYCKLLFSNYSGSRLYIYTSLDFGHDTQLIFEGSYTTEMTISEYFSAANFTKKILIPDAQNASQGDVLSKLVSGGIGWQAPAAGGGTQLYLHELFINGQDYTLINMSSTEITDIASWYNAIYQAKLFVKLARDNAIATKVSAGYNTLSITTADGTFSFDETNVYSDTVTAL